MGEQYIHSRRDKRSGHECETHNREIGRVIFPSIKIRCKSGSDGGAGAVRYTGQDKPHNTQP